MKPIFLSLLLLASVSAAAQSERMLPAPEFPTDGQPTLSEVLMQRRSVREYADRDLSDAVLSCVLWAACGVSDPATGKITAPSAVNRQDIDVYVCTARGAFRYDAKKNSLTLVSTKDLRRALADRQEFAAAAPVNLLLVSRTDEFPRRGHDFGCMDAGYVSQNIYLVCTALGLGTVARATMDIPTVTRELQLPQGHEPILNHPVGYLTTTK